MTHPTELPILKAFIRKLSEIHWATEVCPIANSQRMQILLNGSKRLGKLVIFRVHSSTLFLSPLYPLQLIDGHSQNSSVFQPSWAHPSHRKMGGGTTWIGKCQPPRVCIPFRCCLKKTDSSPFPSLFLHPFPSPHPVLLVFSMAIHDRRCLASTPPMDWEQAPWLASTPSRGAPIPRPWTTRAAATMLWLGR